MENGKVPSEIPAFFNLSLTKFVTFKLEIIIIMKKKYSRIFAQIGYVDMQIRFGFSLQISHLSFYLPPVIYEKYIFGRDVGIAVFHLFQCTFRAP